MYKVWCVVFSGLGLSFNGNELLNCFFLEIRHLKFMTLPLYYTLCRQGQYISIEFRIFRKWCMIIVWYFYDQNHINSENFFKGSGLFEQSNKFSNFQKIKFFLFMVFSGSFEKQISQGMFQISQNIQHVFILDFHVRKRGKIQVWKITVKMPTKDFQAFC